jgi:hypothetical protein
MTHKLWWLLGGIFLLSKSRPSLTTTPAGGMSPSQSADGTIGTAINQKGQAVNVSQPLATTVTQPLSPSQTFGASPDDDAMSSLPPLTGDASQGPLAAAAGPAFIATPIIVAGAPGQVPISNISAIFKISPPAGGAAPSPNDTGTTAPLLAPVNGQVVPGMATGDPRASATVVGPFDLNSDDFFVPGLGEETFSPGVLTPDQKLAILRGQGYTGADPRQVPTTPAEQLVLAQPLVNPLTGRVSLNNV